MARSADILTLGIDAEPHAPLPDNVIEIILATPEEEAALTGLTRLHPGIHWDRLLFSAKETVYKAWYPFHHRMLAFKEAELLFTRGPQAPGDTAPAHGTYTARLLIPGPLLTAETGPEVFTGRWIVRDGYLATAIVVPNE